MPADPRDDPDGSTASRWGRLLFYFAVPLGTVVVFALIARGLGGPDWIYFVIGAAFWLVVSWSFERFRER